MRPADATEDGPYPRATAQPPGPTPDRTPGRTPDRTPGRTPGRTPERTGRTPGHTGRSPEPCSGTPIPDDPGPGDDPGPRPDEGRRISRARAFLRALPVLLVAVGAVYDYCTSSEFTAAPFFTAAPLVAAPLYSRRGTVVTGISAVTVVFALHLTLGIAGRTDAVTELATVATVAALAVLINALVRRSSEQLASAREVAEAAQRAVLPEPPERIGGFQVAACYEAARADAFIGGDLYAVQDSPYGIRLIVGDVRGKGMGAVAAVAVVIGAFREAAEQETTLEDVAQRLERALAREGARRAGLDAFEGFTTAVLAELPHGGGRSPADGVVRLLNRGHPPPVLLYADGTLRALPPAEPALPLGMGELGPAPDRADEAGFPRGATLLLYTDGLSESRDGHGRFYDVETRLAGRVVDEPGALLAAVAEDVRRHSGGGMTDDMALLAVRRP